MTNTTGSADTGSEAAEIQLGGGAASGESLELLQQLHSRYMEADRFARKVANFRDDVAIPAHNELRYAGYHLLIALAGQGENVSTNEELRNAISHCRRSIFEAAEAGIISALDMIAIFQDDYKSVTISDIVPDYHTINKNAREAQSLLEQNRERGTDGATLHDDYSVLFDRLTTDVAILEEHRDELNKKMRIDRLHVLRYWFAITITVVIGVLGIILTT